MPHDGNKLKRSALNLREHMSALERDWLSGCLLTNIGIKAAIYSDRNPKQLVVEYDSELINGADLLDILYRRGLRADLRTADITPVRTVTSVSPC